MAKASKPTQLISSHLTKAEKQARIDEEEKLKGSDSRVYTPPKHLNREEKQLYIEIVTDMKESGVLSNLDIELICILVDAVINMREMKNLLKKDGKFLTKKDGTIYRHPAINSYKDYEGIYNRCCRELSLTVSARAKLGQINATASEESNDDVLKILGGGVH